MDVSALLEAMPPGMHLIPWARLQIEKMLLARGDMPVVQAAARILGKLISELKHKISDTVNLMHLLPD